MAFDAAKVMEEKQGELTSADQTLAEAREGLAAAERELDRARKAAQVPAGAAAISDVTIRANASFMQADEVWDTLSRADKQRVQRMGRAEGHHERPGMARDDARGDGDRRRCGMSGQKKLRKKLGKKVLAGKMTVDRGPRTARRGRWPRTGGRGGRIRFPGAWRLPPRRSSRPGR